MFIPLTINKADDELINIGLIGDTAYIFYMLAFLSLKKCNIFLCDTGIAKPLRSWNQLKKPESKNDKANVYYDFFDGKIGQGIIERFDTIVTNDKKIKQTKQAVISESLSSWDSIGELKAKGYTLLVDGVTGKTLPQQLDDTVKLIELGIPELDYITVLYLGNHNTIELTGDLSRVFDGLM